MVFRLLIIGLLTVVSVTGHLQAALMHDFDFNTNAQGWTVTVSNGEDPNETFWDPNLQCLNAGNAATYGDTDYLLSPPLAVTNGAQYTIVFDYTTNTNLSQAQVHFFSPTGVWLGSIQVPTTYLAATHSIGDAFAWQKAYHTFTASWSGQTVGVIQISAANYSGWGRAQFDNVQLHSGTFVPSSSSVLCSYDFTSNAQGWTLNTPGGEDPNKTYWDPNTQSLSTGGGAAWNVVDYFTSPAFKVTDGAQYTIVYDYTASLASGCQVMLHFYAPDGTYKGNKLGSSTEYLSSTTNSWDVPPQPRTFKWERKSQTFTASAGAGYSGQVGFVKVALTNYTYYGRAWFDNIEIRSGSFTPPPRTILCNFDFSTGAQGWKANGPSYDLYWNSAMKCLDTWWHENENYASQWFVVNNGAQYTAVLDYTTTSDWAYALVHFYSPNGVYRGNIAISPAIYLAPSYGLGNYALSKKAYRTFSANAGPGYSGDVGFAMLALYNNSIDGRTQFDNAAIHSGAYIPPTTSITTNAAFDYNPEDPLADHSGGGGNYDWSKGKNPSGSAAPLPGWESNNGSGYSAGCLTLWHNGEPNTTTWWVTGRIAVTDGAPYTLFYDYSTDTAGSYASIHLYSSAGAWLGHMPDYDVWENPSDPNTVPSLNPTGANVWKRHSRVFVPHLEGQTIGYVAIAFYHTSANGGTRFDNMSLKKGPLYADADFDKDDRVNLIDLKYFTEAWLDSNNGCGPVDLDVRDLNGDCKVNFRDFAELAGSWMQTTTW